MCVVVHHAACHVTRRRARVREAKIVMLCYGRAYGHRSTERFDLHSISHGSLREYSCSSDIRNERLTPIAPFPKTRQGRHRPLRPSLPGSCHRPSGTDPSPAITPASPTSALVARALGTLVLLVTCGDDARNERAGLRHWPTGHSHRLRSNPGTRWHVTSAGIASQAMAMASGP